VDVRITWPGSDDQSIVQDLEGVAVPGRITVYEGLTSADVPEPGEVQGDLGFRAFPNPMSHTTNLEFESPGRVIHRIEIFNVGGRMVRALSPHVSATGSYLVSWDGRIAGGAKAPAGVYRIVGRGEGASVSGRVLLLH
jgi:hypothetical protein